ncbi:MAG: universal stress protein [Candidatus Pelagadaptatus aseana]|uniref:universal stress protein n=1 Tax=Candidatus Pelagadaptatus aseana TaxID=3120508 RepID=UPI0039B1F140
MKRFNNILVVVKGEDEPETNPAVIRAAALARQNSASLTLMDVVHPPESNMSELKGIIEPDELLALLVNQRHAALTAVAESLAGLNNVEVKIAVGRDFIEIVRQVILAGHDLLIKVANEHADNFDSSDFHLMRKCPQPVWLLKPAADSKAQKILAAIDLNLEDHEEGRALNAMIMDLATTLASEDDSELHVLSCWSLYGESSLRNSAFMRVSEERITELLDSERRANQALQDALVSRYQAQAIHTHLLKGSPVDLIPQFARANHVSAVVMGTVARTGVPGLLIGNTAEEILRLIDTSVITLKPSGFESPVK